MLGTKIQRQVPKGVPTKDNRRPAKDAHIDQSIPVHMGIVFQPNVDITKKNIRADKPPSADMFKQIGMYSTQEYMMPSCISITDKMARTTGANQGLGFNQSTPIHQPDPNRKGIFDKSVSIGKIGWNPQSIYPRISTSSF
jgi:hypothetical protein